MKLRKPQPGTGQTWAPFWSCVNYPDCRGKIEVNNDDLRYLLDYQ